MRYRHSYPSASFPSFSTSLYPLSTLLLTIWFSRRDRNIAPVLARIVRIRAADGVDEVLFQPQQLHEEVGHEREQPKQAQHRPDILRVVLHLHVDEAGVGEQPLKVALLGHVPGGHGAVRRHLLHGLGERGANLLLGRKVVVVLVQHDAAAGPEHAVELARDRRCVAGVHQRLHGEGAVERAVGNRLEAVVVHLLHRHPALQRPAPFPGGGP